MQASYSQPGQLRLKNIGVFLVLYVYFFPGLYVALTAFLLVNSAPKHKLYAALGMATGLRSSSSPRTEHAARRAVLHLESGDLPRDL